MWRVLGGTILLASCASGPAGAPASSRFDDALFLLESKMAALINLPTSRPEEIESIRRALAKCTADFRSVEVPPQRRGLHTELLAYFDGIGRSIDAFLEARTRSDGNAEELALRTIAEFARATGEAIRGENAP